MAKSIVISADGDELKTTQADTTKIQVGHLIGTHDVCGGQLFLKTGSAAKHVILCSECGLRVTIPVDTDTYEKLRNNFSIWNTGS
ncbi:hypothetical protein KKF61_05880 [Patescibacteria group bacterium]|nr:hypothetical protein [Patescibacteria group bacterium]MBU0963925.1 hypothetical protein [Patescibacteria group bacterium]